MNEPGNTPEQDYIIDHVGAENWQQVKREFCGWNVYGLCIKLDVMFPNSDAAELEKLAWMIYTEVTK